MDCGQWNCKTVHQSQWSWSDNQHAVQRPVALPTDQSTPEIPMEPLSERDSSLLYRANLQTASKFLCTDWCCHHHMYRPRSLGQSILCATNYSNKKIPPPPPQYACILHKIIEWVDGSSWYAACILQTIESNVYRQGRCQFSWLLHPHQMTLSHSLRITDACCFLLLIGHFTYSEDICKLWITTDLFFCNNTSLHLAFANMDMFLRLKDPLRHGRIITTCSLILWLGAPWTIAFVQAIAQFMLSQADHGIIHNGICFIADKNFVILGTLFSFFIPTVISIAFYVLCVHEIKALKKGRFLEESDVFSS